MQANYPASLKAVLRSEGGYVNNPADPGGATNFGIIQRTYDAWNDSHGRAHQSVRLIGLDEVAAIYKAEYWDAVHADGLPAGLDYVVFDYGVNSGPHRALAAYAATPTIDGICDARLAFLRGLSTWGTFGRGWTTRVANVRALGKFMEIAALPAAAGPKPPVAAPLPQPAPIQPYSMGPIAALIRILVLLFKGFVK